MKYLLINYYGSYRVLNDDADAVVAYVDAIPDGSGYRVQIALLTDELPEFVIKSINEAIPAVAAYYEANPHRWEPRPRDDQIEPCRACYIKDTQFGILRVRQTETGQWVAYRDDDGLSFDGGKIAVFATCEEAQRAAAAHFRDGYPNSETINDGLSWPVDHEWWTDPYSLANRARFAVK
jgi:hypothetical protein